MKPFNEAEAKAGDAVALSDALSDFIGLSKCRYVGMTSQGRVVLESDYKEVFARDKEDVFMWEEPHKPTTYHIGIARHDGQIKCTYPQATHEDACIYMPNSWELIKVIEVEV